MADKKDPNLVNVDNTTEFLVASSKLGVLLSQETEIDRSLLPLEIERGDKVSDMLEKFTESNDELFGVDRSEIKQKKIQQRQLQIYLAKKSIDKNKKITKIDQTVANANQKIGWSKSLIAGVIIEIIIGTFFVIWSGTTVFWHDWYYSSFYTDVLNIEAPARAMPISICVLKFITSIMIVVFAIIFATTKGTWARATSSSLIIFQMILTMFNYAGIWLSIVIWLPIAILVIFGKTIYEYEKISKFYHLRDDSIKSDKVLISNQIDEIASGVAKVDANAWTSFLNTKSQTKSNARKRNYDTNTQEGAFPILGNDKIDTFKGK